MSGYLPQEIIDQIIDRTDIVQLISGYIPLKRAGRNFRALCPFHHEKTPSFIISPQRQIYHCFGCGVGGNAINFLTRYERLEFKEAIEVLAKKAGITLPVYSKQDSAQASGLRLKLYNIMQEATLFYLDCLLNSKVAAPAREYLKKRLIQGETIKEQMLGFAPDSRNAILQHLRDKNFTLDLIEKAGLIIHNQGRFYDRFRNRIIFPIFDVKSRPIAFGARLLPYDSESRQTTDIAKYINSPETPIYTKGRNLYGLNFSKEAIRQQDCVIIVEGYFDFVLPYQKGQTNITASLGTALTQDQTRLLKRYTNNVIVVYDADKAGELATLRSLDLFIEEDINPKIASLAVGLDPDSYVRKYGIEEFRKKTSVEAKNIFDYKLGALLNKYERIDTEAKADIVAEMISTINKFKNEILRSNYLKSLAQALDLSEESVIIEAKKAKSNQKYTFESKESSFIIRGSIRPVEKLILRLMLEETAFISKIRQCLGVSDFQSEQMKKIVQILFDCDLKGTSITLNKLISLFSDETITSMLAELATFVTLEPETISKEKILEDCIARIRKESLRLKRTQLCNEIKNAQEMGNAQRLNDLVVEYNKAIKEEG